MICVRCGQSNKPGLRRCDHPAGHIWRDTSTRLGAKAKPLAKAGNGDRTAGYLQHIANARHHMERAQEELRLAREIHYEWDLELTGRQIGTLVYFLLNNAKI